MLYLFLHYTKCPNALLPKSPMKLRHGWPIISHKKQQDVFYIYPCHNHDNLKQFMWVSEWYDDIFMLNQGPGDCFINVSRALQNNLAKIHNTRNHIYGENFKLKLCACAQSMALGTRTKFQLEIRITSIISAIHKFRENILESSRNVSETSPSSQHEMIIPRLQW